MTFFLFRKSSVAYKIYYVGKNEIAETSGIFSHRNRRIFIRKCPQRSKVSKGDSGFELLLKQLNYLTPRYVGSTEDTVGKSIFFLSNGAD